MLRFLIVACGLCVTPVVFGQTTYTWTNQVDGNIATAANYNPNGQPSGATQDTAQWDGQTTGALGVYSTTASLPSTGFGSSGINLVFTANQLGSVTFTSAVATAEAAYGVNNIDIESPSAAITFGHPGLSSTYQYNFFGRPAGGVHAFINNSSQPATFNGNVRWQAGGGAAYTLDFQGTGNWVANNYLVNDNNSGMIIGVEGPGTLIWTPGGYLGNSGINSPIVINGGKLVLAAPHPKISNQNWTLGGIFEFNAPAQAQTLSGIMAGGGILQVSSGTLTLSGQSTYTGSNILSGGEVVLNGAENDGVSGPLGEANTISFKGGTLGYSVNNVFDYSGRFDTSSVQAYSIDTAGQNVIFTNAAGLSGSGSSLAKLGSGTLTLAGPSTYTGLTTVNAGRLVFQGSKTGSGSITVADGAALGVTGTGTQVTPGTLTVGSSSGATLGFDNVNSTTTALIAAGTLTTAGTVTVNVNSGPLNPGQSYPLFTWTSGLAPGVSLGVLNGFIGNLSTNGNSIVLNVTATAYKWTGINNNSWDLVTGNNWLQNGGAVVYADGGPVLFDDTATTTNVTISGVVQPSSVSVNNNSVIYTITSSVGNDIGGSASLTKNGNSTLTLAGGANAYTGVTTVSGGSLSVGALANGGTASDIGAASSSAASLVLDGGTLQYTGGAASIDRLFTVGTGGGAIDASGTGALTLNNTASIGYSGNGPRTLTLKGTGTGNTLATAIGNNGGATALTMSGSGTWVLTGANTYSGVTTIASGGTLQIGNGGASGTLGSGNVVNIGGLDFNRTGSVTVSGAISGSGAVTNDGSGTVILAGNNSYTGGTYINAGTLQIGNGGATGKLDGASPIVDNGTLIFNSTSALTIAGFNVGITGTGNVWVRGTGLFKEIGANAYTGWTLIDAGASFQVSEGNAGGLLSSVVTNNGTLIFGRQDNGVFGYTNNIVGTGKFVKEVNNTQGGGDVTLAGTNSYTGGTYIAGGGVILGDGINTNAGTIVGGVIFTNSPVGDNPRILTFNRPDDFTFTNTISSVATGYAGGNGGRVVQGGLNVVTLTGNNTYPSGTTINQGATLQVGNGGTSGSIGTGGVANDGVLIFNRSDSVTFGGAIANSTVGGGSLVKLGAGTLTLTASNSYTGPTTISNGTLVVSGGYIGGDLNLEGGTVAAAATAIIGTLNVAGNMTIDSGTVLIALNKALVQSNSYVLITNEVSAIAGNLTATGGSLKLVNYGPNLAVGDKFTIFSEPVTGGAGMTISSPGFTVANNLAVDGSVTVTAINVLPPPTITATVASGNLTLTWPSSWTGAMRVQNQTNALSRGLSTNWVTIPGTEASNSYTTPINKTNGNVFFRLAP